MSKLSYEDKIDIYNDRKTNMSIKDISLKYGIAITNVKYLIRLIDKHGFDVLRTEKNKYYSKKEKERIINRVLIKNESITSVSIDEGMFGSGMLTNWVKKYKENGYNIEERKRGRNPMFKPNKNIQNKESDQEKIERLEKENLYLKAELEYSKKLRAVVQVRKNQQQKKK